VLGDHELLGKAEVEAPSGHQPEHLELALGQLPERIAPAPRAPADCEGVARPRELREHENPDLRPALGGSSVPARSPSSVRVGGIRMSTIATSGRCASTRATSCSPSSTCDDLTAGVGEQPRELIAQQHRVVGEDHPHGISARSTVTRSGGLTTWCLRVGLR
jgi:hypothetical protein